MLTFTRGVNAIWSIHGQYQSHVELRSGLWATLPGPPLDQAPARCAVDGRRTFFVVLGRHDAVWRWLSRLSLFDLQDLYIISISDTFLYNIWYYMYLYVIYGWFFWVFDTFDCVGLPRQGRNLTTIFFSVVGSPSVRTIAISLPSSVEPLSDGYQQQAKGGKLEPYLPRLFEVFSRRYRMKEKHFVNHNYTFSWYSN